MPPRKLLLRRSNAAGTSCVLLAQASHCPSFVCSDRRGRRVVASGWLLMVGAIRTDVSATQLS